MLVLLLGCFTERNYERQHITEITSGGGTARTFYAVVAERTYETPMADNGLGESIPVDAPALVSSTTTLIRCSIEEDGLVCQPALTDDQATQAARGPVTFSTAAPIMPKAMCPAVLARIDQMRKAGTPEDELPAVPEACKE